MNRTAMLWEVERYRRLAREAIVREERYAQALVDVYERACTGKYNNTWISISGPLKMWRTIADAGGWLSWDPYSKGGEVSP